MITVFNQFNVPIIEPPTIKNGDEFDEDEVNEEYEKSTEDINKVEDEGADVNVVGHFFGKERGTYTMTKTIMT